MKAVLFDVDGVLLDSSATYMRIWRAWTAYHNLDFELVWAATHGRRVSETLADVAGHLDPVVEEARLRDLMLAEGDAFPAMPAAASLLTGLPAGRWAVVTSGAGDSVRRRFRAAGLPVPAVLVDNGSVSSGKPDPEGYLTAATALSVDARQCLVVEDAPAGVDAGKAAGMTVIALATTHARHGLSRADLCVGSLGDAAQHIHAWLASSDG